jgi:GNAT superfamily N-acetyltransferase
MKSIKICNSLPIESTKKFKEKLNKYYETIKDSGEIVTLGQTVENIKHLTPREMRDLGCDFALFAIKNNEVVAFLTIGGADGEDYLEEQGIDWILNCLFVFPKHRNQNIGKKLLREIKKMLKNEKIFLTATSLEVEDFYRKNGFKNFEWGMLWEEC